MNLPRISALILGLSLFLASCGGGSTPTPNPPPDTQLTEANAWKGAIPADAETVSPEDFKKGLASGELALFSTASLEAQKAAYEKQYQDDKTFLSSLPDKSPYVQKLLEEAASVPSADTDLPAPGAKGVLLLGVAQQLRGAVESYKRAQDPGNALEDYTTSYNLLPDDLKAKADSPESLKGKSLDAINAAATKLSELLSSVENLDNSRLDTDSSSASLSQSGLLSSQTLNAGNGVDNNGPCSPVGLVKTYWFPLKKFVSPIKNQAQRGTCWAFAAIGAVESRERVQNNNPVNLSEQFLVNKVKQDWDSSDTEDGYWSDKALETAVNKGQVFPSEGAWTYNPANSRPYPKYDNTCAGYSGTCSDTAHESRRTCTTFIFTFCSYVKVTYLGPGVGSSRTNLVWSSGKSFDLNRYRSLLAKGYTLLADFPVYVGVMDRATGGYVTDYSQTYFPSDGPNKGKEIAGSYGGHAVQLVGFLSNDTLSKYNSVSNIGGGGYFILKNSWGCGGGDGGYYYVPADYVQKIFGSLRTLNFDGRRSDAWNKEQAAPGGTEAPKIQIKSNPATVDLRVEKDLTAFFSVSHPVAKSVTLTVTSSLDGTLYNGPWSTDPNEPFGPSLKRTFATPGTRTLTLRTQYGSGSSSASLSVNVVNTPPTLELQKSGDARQGEEYSLTALITDPNEADLNKLCANTLWSVDAPDTLSSAVGCTVVVKFGAQGVRAVRVSTQDSEGASGSSSVTLSVLPPPVNPFPKIVSSGVYSREYVVGAGTLRFCDSPAVPLGNTLDLTQQGCNFIAGKPLPPRYFGGVKVENPDREALTFDWKLLYRNSSGSEVEGLSSPGSSASTFSLSNPGNAYLATFDCRVTLKVNAPEASRSKGPLSVWSGKCTAFYGTAPK